MHDGTNRTPNTTWLSYLPYVSDWNTANDPCNIELGSAWRIPTVTEWINVDNAGGWTNWSGPWVSGLKLHAAGYLDELNGSILNRGSGGYYSSSTQSTYDTENNLYFNNGNCYISNAYKASGFPLRCLRDGCAPPSSPSSGSHASSATQIIWNWNTVADAVGYKWNMTNDYASAADLGVVTAKTETGLICNTAFTRYVWAYNGCGNSTATTLAQSTSVCPSFTCGVEITVNHIVGEIAPVNKTVTYGTVTNIPGEAFKCWITKNLGATQQATAVNDATEPSAGWLWQFNRKQGYMHDGTTRTPNNAWTNSISETSDWLAVNDPCTLELGNGWRIPTSAEWNNVNDTGSWTDWEGPWTSALKLHAAGQLNSSNGSLNSRGTGGYYWSSTQYDASYGWNLHFYNGGSEASIVKKASGFSARCVRE
jgi:hypothetical protein